MKKIQMKKQNEDAVSPVIGVMLMLVVTIVIAAVVAAFAGGLATEAEPVPAAVLDADVYAGDQTLVLRSFSGENLRSDETNVKVQDGKGNLLATGSLDPSISAYFSPGMTQTINLDVTGSLDYGQYVNVLVIVDGKHIVLNKEVLVKL
ncbi:MAG: type IV pilin N-terminal domain-containing protein [Methanocorpusculum sp.]|nr:type IV pilin N-terminal domain-containing protein [Methanocorpusculum sp.]